jgi:putative thioredoxin
VPVLVDFWAPWCGPCRVLGPILEKLASQSGGRWILKKVNVDENQDLSAEYNVRGIPAVKLFSQGVQVSEFTGALPEIEIANWLKNNLPSENDEKAEQALLYLENDNPEKAIQLFEEVLTAEPNHIFSAFFLGKMLLFDNPERAFDLFSVSEKAPHYLDESDYFKLLAHLVRDKDKAEAFAEDPVKTIFIDAIHALSQQNFDLALEKFIDVIIRNKSYHDEAARKACVGVFYFLGPDHETTRKFRRKFDMALY